MATFADKSEVQKNKEAKPREILGNLCRHFFLANFYQIKYIIKK